MALTEKQKIDQLEGGTKRVCIRVTNVTHAKLRARADADYMKFGDWMLEKIVEIAYEKPVNLSSKK